MPSRQFLLVTHPAKPEAVAASKETILKLQELGIGVVLAPSQKTELLPNSEIFQETLTLGDDVQLSEVELAIVLGGDGTILRTAELINGFDIPILGVNLGHVGFLAESEKENLAATIKHAVGREFTVEQRSTLEVTVTRNGEPVFSSWALNEVSVEKASRERMLELVLEVDKLPVSSFGADGIVVATPTGSTAYAFSAGGPVIWPSISAVLIVPISAHALFSRPLVVGPESVVAIELIERNTGEGIIWCDGRRSFQLLSGDRVEITSSPETVSLARIIPTPFSHRLVQKFSLPVTGWRGPASETEA